MPQYPNTSNIDWIDSTVAGQGDELVDQQDVNFAEHVNELRGEVKAIALELGANPRGGQSTVRARLENIESTKSSTSHNHDTAYVARSVLAAKGNILTATGAATPAAFGPGANGTVLMFDSAQATGMKGQALDHGAHLGGLGDDDHPHYLNNARHALVNHAGIPGVPPYPFVGMVVDSARPDVPPLWLECNGQAVSRTTYADLFAAINTQFGAGDGSTTFNVPNSVGRIRLHLDPGRTAWDTLGKTGGADTVVLTTAQLPSHAHSGPSHSHSTPSHTHTFSDTTTTDSHSHGSSGSHDHTEESVVSSGNQSPSGSGWFIPTGSVRATGGTGSHTHSTDSHNHVIGGTTSSDNGGNTGASGTGNTGSTGSGSAHENMPPYMVFKALIFAGA